MNRVLVIGATGLVGSRFVELAKNKQSLASQGPGRLDIIAVDENTLDITDKSSVEKYFNKNPFDSVVNFAAIANVDGAEKERNNKEGIVWKLNVEALKNLIEICNKTDRFLVQISTDFVFEGTTENSGPYDEYSLLPKSLSPNLSWYGWSKNRAEYIVQSTKCRSAIVRIAYPFYASKYELKLDFAKNYLKLYDDGKLFPLFTDQTLNVLNVDDLIDPLVKILVEEIQGTFHIVSNDTTTPFNFVEYLLKKVRNVENVLEKGSMAEFLKIKDRTPRPRLGGLKTEITEKKLGIKFKNWQEMVDDFVLNI